LNQLYYSKELQNFLDDDDSRILEVLTTNHQFTLEEHQRNAWVKQIQILKKEFKNLENEFMKMKFDLAELLPKEGKKSKLNFEQNNYSEISKHVKYGDGEDIYVKDLDGGEIVF